jgi:hypothetical protein
VFPGGPLHQKIGRNAFVQGELAFMHLGALFRLNFSVLFFRWCRALLPHLEESAIFRAFYLGCVEPLPLP